jgi:gliding motility-associated-like protein
MFRFSDKFRQIMIRPSILMKRIFFILSMVFPLALPLYAMHIRGGELSYRYLRPGSTANTSLYSLTLKLYIDCTQNSAGQLDTQVFFSVFKKSNNSPYGGELTVPMTKDEFIRYDPNSNPCITNPPTDVCYRLRYFETTVELPNDPQGYVISFQRCCRIGGIVNVQPPSNGIGATYMCTIPGTSSLPDAPMNSSPQLQSNDAIAICAGSAFTFDFSATDLENDSLRYTLCEAYIGGSQGSPSPRQSAPPPYSSVNYSSGFSGGEPLGSSVKLDPATGFLSGIAPPIVGQYVITACVYEYRRGVLINVHRKDIHLKVSDCNPLKAQLNPEYSFCDDYSVSFWNGQVNPTGTVYTWDFGDGTPVGTSTDPVGFIEHKYADTGTYHLKLTATLAGQCVDNTTSLARVYPGFFPDFNVIGSCKLNPFTFQDRTRTVFGFVDKWSWDFGDETATADSSQLQNPSWKYSTTGFKEVRLIVGTNKGCLDTLYNKDVEVRDKPLINVPFKDTLICSIDTLQLQASGLGNFSWSPNISSLILNPNNANPLVFPKTTTLFTVTLDEFGCVNTETVRVRVVDFVTLDAGPDATICLTDPITLQPTGDALKYKWADPTNTLSSVNVRNPIAIPKGPTTYQVTASIGKCNVTDAVTINTVPYPGSNAGSDVTICYEDTTRLNGSIKGSTFTWSPVNTLISPTTLNPLAYPLRTTSYVLTVYDNLGCPKPKRDTVVVTVRNKIIANAGRDTSVVIGQPLQLHGSGADMFLWTPPTGLNNPNTDNPIANLTENVTYELKAYTEEGCTGYDTINVKVFKTAPDIFVPNAFTPDRTTNNVFRPIPVGISQVEFFQVFNRWGQMVYSSNDIERGWDGKYGGKAQAPGGYVWMVQGKDFTGKTIFKKGTMILIR